METIKRTIVQQKMKSDNNDNTFQWVNATGVTYEIKVLLTNKSKDFGFFDVVPFLDVNTTGITITSNGIGEFHIETNIDWIIKKDEDWIVLDNYVGKNDAKISINLGKHLSTPRIGTITIIPKKMKLIGLEKKIKITQTGVVIG